VVDPMLDGKIKITVIATGFDLGSSARSTPGAAPVQTPVDLQSYTAQTPGRPAAGRPSVDPLPARLTIARRPAVELPPTPPRMAAAGAATAPRSESAADMAEGDTNLELEVPAFLRRSEA
jgi:hypothetical protein